MEHETGSADAGGRGLFRRTERAKAAGEAAAAQLQTRAGQATDWARSGYSALNERVDANPRLSALLALGTGIIIGLLLRRRRDYR